MAITIAEIQHLRKMTGAGMMDCKNALTEANGDFDKAMEIIRKKGQAVAAKREDREASEGCVLAKTEGDFAAIVALQCETDFVAKNAEFVALQTEKPVTTSLMVILSGDITTPVLLPFAISLINKSSSPSSKFKIDENPFCLKNKSFVYAIFLPIPINGR
jgi:hypothetical protein